MHRACLENRPMDYVCGVGKIFGERNVFALINM